MISTTDSKCGHSRTKWPHQKGFSVEQAAVSFHNNCNMKNAILEQFCCSIAIATEAAI